MDEDQFKEISEKLDRISKLLALSAIKGLEPDRQVEALSAMGLQPFEIATIVGRTPNAVRIALHNIRKGSRKPKKALSTPKKK